MKLPIVRTHEVFHIGTLNPEDKASRFSNSFEGPCLSVSHCPDAWCGIARLGGQSWWSLHNEEGGIFLDVLKAQRQKTLRRTIEQWGIDHGYASLQPRWKTWSTDEEGRWCFILFPSEHEALDQADVEELDHGPHGGPVVESVQVLIGTPQLSARLNVSNVDGQDAFEFLALAWVETTQPHLDGVWWRETYDPCRLSAPRGGILPHRVGQWTSRPVSPHDVMDDENEERLDLGHAPIVRMAFAPPTSGRSAPAP